MRYPNTYCPDTLTPTVQPLQCIHHPDTLPPTDGLLKIYIYNAPTHWHRQYCAFIKINATPTVTVFLLLLIYTQSHHLQHRHTDTDSQVSQIYRIHLFTSRASNRSLPRLQAGSIGVNKVIKACLKYRPGLAALISLHRGIICLIYIPIGSAHVNCFLLIAI